MVCPLAVCLLTSLFLPSQLVGKLSFSFSFFLVLIREQKVSPSERTTLQSGWRGQKSRKSVSRKSSANGSELKEFILFNSRSAHSFEWGLSWEGGNFCMDLTIVGYQEMGKAQVFLLKIYFFF